MKSIFLRTATALSILCVSNAAHAAATIIDFGDPSSIPGVETFQYDAYVVISPGQTASWTSDTDAYSWDHPNLASENPALGNQTGWTHLTRWVAVTVTQPLELTIQIDRATDVQIPDQNNLGAFISAGNDLIPAITVWSGFEVNAEDGSLGLANPNGGHRWDNDGDQTAWMEQLTYVAHDGNNANNDSVVLSLSLDAGNYTFNVAGSKDGAFDPGTTAGDLRKGFTATLTAVPEPSSLLLTAGGVMLLIINRRRPNVA